MLYRFDNFVLDAENFELRLDGITQHVEPQVFDFLYFLLQHNGRVVTRDEIIEKVWHGRIVSDTTISSCVKSARKILGDDGELQKYIKTSRGRGFQFVGTINSDAKPDNQKPHADYQKVTSHINKSTVTYLVITGLVFIIGLLLYNQYTITGGGINDSTSQETILSGAPYTIAVMPFVDLSADGTQEYFGDGISEEVLNVLTAVNGLEVTSRTTAFSLKGQNLSVPEISERLNVNYIVEGSIRSSGDRIRITAQLIDANSDSHLWSENYDRELVDIFAIQDDISQQIADSLKVELIGNSLGREAPTTNMEAYALYLQGHQLFLNRGTDDIAKNIENLENAIDLLEQSVSLDPIFAEAWADLATSNIILPSYFDEDYSFEKVAPRATEAANRAISLDPNLSQAWAVKGFIHLNRFQFQDAQSSILRATELNPNNETAWLWLGLHFAAVGNQDKAMEAVEKAIKISPSVAINHSASGIISHARGEIEKAVGKMDKAIIEMGFDAGRPDRALVAVWNNNIDRAREEMLGFFKSYNQTSGTELANKLEIYAKAYSDPALHDQVNILLKKDIANGFDTTFGLFMLQDGAKIVHNYETTTANKGFNLARIYYPLARPLFKQNIFKNFIIKIGLLTYWQNNEFPYFCKAIGESDFECET